MLYRAVQVPGFQTISYPIEASVSRRGEVVRTATLGLARRVTREDLTSNNASLNIKCVASIYTAYYKTVELVASLKVRKKTKRRRENLKKKLREGKNLQTGAYPLFRREILCAVEAVPAV